MVVFRLNKDNKIDLIYALQVIILYTEILHEQSAQQGHISLVKARVHDINEVLEPIQQVKLQFNEFIENLDFISHYTDRLIEICNAQLELIQIEDIMDIEKIAQRDIIRIKLDREHVKFDHLATFQM